MTRHLPSLEETQRAFVKSLDTWIEDVEEIRDLVRPGGEQRLRHLLGNLKQSKMMILKIMDQSEDDERET